MLQMDGTCKTKKEACEQVGISTRAFDRFIVSNPEMVQLMQQSIRSHFASRLDQMTENSVKNLDAFLAISDTLRNELLANVSTPNNVVAMDIDNVSKIVAVLDKIEKRVIDTRAQVLPVIKTAELPPPPSEVDDAVIQQLLKSPGAQLTKAIRVTRSTTVEMGQASTGEPREIIEGTVSPAS